MSNPGRTGRSSIRIDSPSKESSAKSSPEGSALPPRFLTPDTQRLSGRNMVNTISGTRVICPFTPDRGIRSEEHTSELQSRENLVCRLLLEKKKHRQTNTSLCTV